MATLYHCKHCNTRNHWATDLCPKAKGVSTTEPKVLAPRVSTKSKRVSTKVLQAKIEKAQRKGDRHRPGYQKRLMQARRAINAGKADPWPPIEEGRP